MIKDICYASDNNYAHLAAISIASLMKYYSDNKNDLTFHVMCINMSDDNKKRFAAVSEQLDVDIRLYDIDMNVLLDRKSKMCRWPVAALTRIFVANILDNDIKKVLYMDCDTIIVDDINPLLKYEIKNNCIIAGVVDISSEAQGKFLGLPSRYKYINSGILILDLEKWRERDVTLTIVNQYNKYQRELEYCDQDLINLACKDWIDSGIPKKYNSIGLQKFALDSFSTNDVVIVHYLGAEYQTRRRDLMNLLMVYYDQLPWIGLPMPDNRKIYEKIIKGFRGWMVVNARTLYVAIRPLWRFTKRLRGKR